MKRAIVVLALASSLALAACAVAPKDPAQAVYQIQGDYVAALSAAVKYKQLPPCSATGPLLCSKPEVVAKLQGADDLAYAALKGAQDAVRALPNVDQASLQQVLSSAEVAVQGFMNAVSSSGGR